MSMTRFSASGLRFSAAPAAGGRRGRAARDQGAVGVEQRDRALGAERHAREQAIEIADAQRPRNHPGELALCVVQAPADRDGGAIARARLERLADENGRAVDAGLLLEIVAVADVDVACGLGLRVQDHLAPGVRDEDGAEIPRLRDTVEQDEAADMVGHLVDFGIRQPFEHRFHGQRIELQIARDIPLDDEGDVGAGVLGAFQGVEPHLIERQGGPGTDGQREEQGRADETGGRVDRENGHDVSAARWNSGAGALDAIDKGAPFFSAPYPSMAEAGKPVAWAGLRCLAVRPGKAAWWRVAECPAALGGGRVSR